LRQVFLAIVLVAAAFTGGAIVNGPGRGWAQAVLNQIRPRGPGLVTTTDNPVPKTQDGEPAQSDPIPAAPVPPLVVGPVPEEPPSKAEAPASHAEPVPASTPSPAIASASTPAPASSSAKSDPATSSEAIPKPLSDANVLALGSAKSPSPFPLEAPAPLPPSSPVEPQTAVESSTSADPTPKKDPGWGDAPGSAPANAALPRSLGPGMAAKRDPAVSQAMANPRAPSSADTANSVEADGSLSFSSKAPTWSDLRRRMRDLGVTRYWIEGEPEGSVRFRCVVPLVGQRAVAQQFEGEGDDAPHAADAALIRVALWRATEVP
jgi:hypothetical protein